MDSEPNGKLYYVHRHGCGSGSVVCNVEINDTTSQVDLTLFRGWMGSGRHQWQITGSLSPISAPIYMIKFHTKGLYFDAYLFDEPLPTEWYHPETTDVTIGLYCGNGCYCTERFQLQLVLNNMTNRFPSAKAANNTPDDSDTICRLLNGMKFEKVTEKEFQKSQSFILANTSSSDDE